MKNNIICIFLCIITSILTITNVYFNVYAQDVTEHNENTIDIQSKSAVVIEGSTGKIL